MSAALAISRSSDSDFTSLSLWTRWHGLWTAGRTREREYNYKCMNHHLYSDKRKKERMKERKKEREREREKERKKERKKE